MDKKFLEGARQHWQAVVTGLLGAWFAVSPWLMDLAGNPLAAAGSVALGLAMAGSAAAMAHPAKAAWGAWLAVAAGVAALASPWLIGFSDLAQATANAVVVGLVATILGLALGLKTIDPDSWWNDRVAH